MIRVVIFLIVLGAIALGANWFADHPGDITIAWQGYETHVSLLTGLLAFVVAVVALIILWSLVRLLLRAPRSMARASQSRRRAKGLAALSSGVVAVGAGDSRAAERHVRDAERLMPQEPLTLLLKAQSAQLAGDRATAEAAFTEMLKNPETRTLGLRGLHVEARRRGDHEAAYKYASEAQKIAPLAWAGHATLQHHAGSHDWDAALAAVERNAAARIIDATAADRQRAVLKTALALEKAEREPDAAFGLARDANRLAPDLVPAAALAGRLTARQGDLTRAMRIIETAWKTCAHPDLAQAYLGVRLGDSARDRLNRARELGQWALEDQEGNITVGRAALQARDADLARRVMAPVLAPNSPLGRPTVRACLLMADIEEFSGAPGKVREWLSRASVAARDPAWVADGIAADEWAPVSPTSGRLDAFVWTKPPAHLTALPPPPITPPTDHGDAEEAPPPGPLKLAAGGTRTPTAGNGKDHDADRSPSEKKAGFIPAPSGAPPPAAA